MAKNEAQELAPVGDVTPLANLSDTLQAKIKATADRLKDSCSVSVNRIAHQATGWRMPDGDIQQTFTGVIVAVKHANIHYPGVYKKGSVNPVDCCAILDGDADAACDNLIPIAAVENPYSSSCRTCPKFEWKSALVGNGKACGEHTLLAVFVPALGDELYVIEMKKANSRVADGYIASVNSKFGHPIAVTTNFTIGRKGDWEVELNAVSNVPTDMLTMLAARMDEGTAMLVERVKGSYKAPTEAANDNEPEAVGRASRSR